MIEAITLAINTKNEIENLVGCIQSAIGVDKIIVGDMASTDGTPALAQAMGAKVYPLADHGFVEPGRRALLSHVKTPWVLILDADERLAGDGVPGLRAMTEKFDDIVAWKLGCRTWFGTREIKGSGWVGHTHMRFFRPELASAPEILHAPIWISPKNGREAIAEGVWFENFAYRQLDDFFAKCLRYGKYGTPPDRSESVVDSIMHGLWELVNRYDPDNDGHLSMALAWGVAMMKATTGMETHLHRDIAPALKPPSRKEFFDAIRDFAERLPNE